MSPFDASACAYHPVCAGSPWVDSAGVSSPSPKGVPHRISVLRPSPGCPAFRRLIIAGMPTRRDGLCGIPCGPGSGARFRGLQKMLDLSHITEGARE
jgi:hypothetical protein